MMRFYILIVCAVLTFGCATYQTTKKVETPSVSKEMGRAFVAEALQHYRFVKDPEVVSMVNRVGYQIIRSIGANPSSYHFLVVQESQPNAFAIPGGYIFVFDGLLAQLSSEEELAGVIAHEIAHVERNHFFKDAKKVAALDIATIAAILLAGGNIATTAIAGAANIDVRLQFSRENEAEADNYALRYLKQGGYSTKGLLDFFDSLIRYERFNPQLIPAYMSTHPGLENRRDTVSNYVTREMIQADQEFIERKLALKRQDWKRILAILNSHDQKWKDEAAILSQLKIDEFPIEERDEMKEYLLGAVYMKSGRFNEAIVKYHSVIERNRTNPVYYSDLSFCYLKQKEMAKAREAALQSLSLMENYIPAHIIIGILEHDSGNTNESIEHLERALNSDHEDQSVNYYLAMDYGKKGDSAREAFYSGRYFRVNLTPEKALNELNRAQGLAPENSPLYFRIMSEIEEIKREGL